MFGRSVKLFSLFGFQVKLDFSWIIIAVLVAWSLSTGYFPMSLKHLSAAAYWIMGIIGALGLFLSIIAHEFSHSLVTRRFGIQMKGITFVYKYHYKLFPVVENGGHLLGCASMKRIKHIPPEKWNVMTAGEIAESCTEQNSIAPDKDATKALAVMQANGLSRLMVVEEDRLVGIVSLKDLMKLISMKVELEE